MACTTSTKRTARVTGGMGGLGEAICFKLAALGFTVVTTCSPGNTKAQQWLQTMKQQGFNFHAYPCDVTDWESCRACVSKITAEIGPIDVLVNNAGITRDMTFRKMDKVNWDAVLHANLDSCFNMTKQVCDGMVDRNWGRIINISSVNGQKGAFGQTNYSAAKAGMHGFSKALALEVARKGVTGNTISPGKRGGCVPDRRKHRNQRRPAHAVSPWRLLARMLTDQLLDHGGVGQRRDVPELIGFVGGDLAQNSSHDLAGARLRQPWRPLDDIGRRNRADFLAHPGAQLRAQRFAGLSHRNQVDVDVNALSLDVMRKSHSGLLLHLRMSHQRPFDFRGAQAVP